MKKITIILTILIAIVVKTNAQIPNNGFENWVTVGNTIEPEDWHSAYSLFDSTGNYSPVTKSTDHYPPNIGSFSARIANDTAIWNTGIAPANFLGWGFITTTKDNDKPLFPVTGHPIALCGYYKFIPQNNDTMNIDVHLYNNSVEITNGTFQSSIAASNWSPFKVFVSDTLYANADSARIGFSSANEPKNGSMPLGNSVLYIDNLSFDNLLSTSIPEKQFKNSFFNLCPNPAQDLVNLNFDPTNKAEMTLTIYNIIGELISTESIGQNHRQINIGELNNGVYIVEIKTKEWSEKQKLIIQR